MMCTVGNIHIFSVLVLILGLDNEITALLYLGYFQPRGFMNKSRESLSYPFLLFDLSGVASLIHGGKAYMSGDDYINHVQIVMNLL